MGHFHIELPRSGEDLGTSNGSAPARATDEAVWMGARPAAI